MVLTPSIIVKLSKKLLSLQINFAIIIFFFLQLLPCLRPPALYVIVYDPMGNRVYNARITNTTEIPIEPGAISLLLNIVQGDGFVGVQVS